MRYYLDADLSPKIVAAVARLDPAIDIIAARAVGHDHWTDPEQLRFATSEGRVFISEDRKDFGPLARETINAGAEFVGMLMLPSSIPSDDYGAIARAIVAFEREHPQGIPACYFDFLRAARA